jgi:hypothetical protein
LPKSGEHLRALAVDRFTLLRRGRRPDLLGNGRLAAPPIGRRDPIAEPIEDPCDAVPHVALLGAIEDPCKVVVLRGNGLFAEAGEIGDVALRRLAVDALVLD